MQLRVLLPDLIPRVDNPILQRDLIYALPTRSPLTAYFQRYLALSFLLYPESLDITFADLKLAKLLRQHIRKSPHFQVRKQTDYGVLTARLALLDIAIGPGPMSVPYQPLVSPPTSNPGSSPVIAPVPVSSEINDFNAEVDTLTQCIKILGNSIVEASASVDLSVLDAKDCIERLTARLEHAVRIGGKKPHNLFGGDDENRQLKVTDIFRKVAKSAAAEPSQGIFDDDGSDHFEDAVAEQINVEQTATTR